MIDLDEERDTYEDATDEETDPSDEGDLDDEDALDGAREEEEPEPVAHESNPEAVFFEALRRLKATNSPTSARYVKARRAWFAYKTDPSTTRMDLMKVYSSPGWQTLRAIYDRTPERKKAKKERDAARWVRTGKAKRAARRASMAIQRHGRVITARLAEIALAGGDVKTLASSLAREAVRQALKQALDGFAAGDVPEERMQFVIMQFESMFGALPAEVLSAAKARKKETSTS